MNTILNNRKNAAQIMGVILALATSSYFAPDGGVYAQEAGTRTAPAVVQTPAVRDAVAIQNAFSQVSQAVEPAVVTITTEQASWRPPSASPRGRGRQWRYNPNSFDGEAGAIAGNHSFEEFLEQFTLDYGFTPNALQREQMRADFYESRFREIQERRRTGLGSGMIYRSDGLILTNAHVVAGARTVTVKLADGREYKDTRVLGIDETTDVAVLKINARGLPTVRLGDSSQVRVGDWAIAVGNPFGLEHTVTVGVISAKAREVPLSRNGAGGGNYLQTDASMNPGNSGGPLCDINGRVVGINNAIFSQTGGNIGIGFAIPINTARAVAERLVRASAN